MRINRMKASGFECRSRLLASTERFRPGQHIRCGDLRIETDDGIVGWGEGKNAAGSAGTYAERWCIFSIKSSPRCSSAGTRATSMGSGTCSTTASATSMAAAPAMRCRGSARRGLTVAAISAIDIALWDIFGKSLGEPVWRLLGGRKADRMPAYASGGWAPAETIGEQLRSYIDGGGFKAVKMRVGAMDGAPHISAARVHAARDALGPDVDIDGRCAWNLYSRRR